MASPAGRADRVNLKQRLATGELVDGVVVKTPSHQVIEVLATAGVNVVMLDLEHSGIGRSAADAMLAVAWALGVDILVRVTKADRVAVQKVLDAGATGVIIPHVTDPATASDVARWAHYGEGGRGYAGTVRSGRWGTIPMADVLAAASDRTVVVVQIEDPVALPHAGAIAATPRVDAVFVGAADLTVAMGSTSTADPAVVAACVDVATATHGAGKALAAYAVDAAEADRWRDAGATLLFHGSDHTRLLAR
jgi:2-keto-3-deoxy-L-rhamnonate aldolase RhmA